MAKQLNKSRQEVVLEFTADTKKAEKELKSLQSSLERLASKNLNTTDLSVTKDLREASNAALMLKNNLASATNVDTGKLDLSKFKKSMEQSNMSLQKYYDELIKLGPAGEQAFSSLASSISKADVKVKHVNKAIQEMKDTFSNTIRWQISSSVLHSLMGAVQSAYGYAQDLNESLNNIRIVTGYSTDQMSKFAEQANRAARALSTTTTEYTNASLIYYQQGLSDTEVQQRTDITIKMANVARQSAEVVSDQMTAIWNNFYDGSKSLEHYADVLTALGAKTASSTDEITGGLEKFAAVADTIGLSYEYAASALATITSNTRESEEVVGTALKTIFARIQGLNLGETLDDGTTLNKYSKALDTVGISIFDQAGQLKEMDAILDELGDKWGTIGKAEQVALAQTVAGVRQYTQLVALMDNWNNGDEDSFQANLATANNASGALQEQSDIYAEGWESARDRVTAAAEAIYAKLINDDAFIGVLNVIEDILNGVSSLIDGVGGLNGVLAIASTLMIKGFSKEISNNIRTSAETLSYFRDRKTSTDKAKDTKREAIDVMIKNNKFMDNDSGRALASTYKGIGELQSFMLNNADRLTDEEKERLQWLMDQNEALAQQVRLQGQVSDKAEADALKQRIAVTSKYKGLESEAVTGYAQSILEGGKAKSFASGLVGRLSSGNTNKQNLQYALKDLDSIIGLQKVVSDSGAGFTDSVEDLNEMVRAAEELRKKIEEISKRDVIREEDEQALRQMAKDAEVLAGKTNAAVDKMKNDSGAMKKMAKGYDPTQQPSGGKKSNQPSWYKKAKKDLLGLADSYEQAGQKAGEAAKGITAFEIANDGVLEIGEKMPGKVIDYADQFAAGAEAAVGYVSALMSIKGAVDSLTNSDLTGWEKFVSVAGSASTAITMVANSSRALTTTFANSTSMVGMFLAKLGAIAPKVALVAAIVGGLVVLFDQLIKTPEEKIADLKKEYDELNAALAETNAELNEVKAAFDKYNTVKDTLDSCVVGTQAWNEALKNVNATVQELITQFPELLTGDWIQRDEKGNLTIDPEFFKQKQKTLETSSVYQQNGIIQNQVQTSNENINSIRRGITGGYLDLINDISNEELINLYNMDSSSRKDYFGKLILENSGNEELSTEQLNHIETLENVFNEQRDEIEQLIQALDEHGHLIENSATIIADNFLRLNGDAKYSQDVINNAGGIYQNVYKDIGSVEYESEEAKQEALQAAFYKEMDSFNKDYLQVKNIYGNDFASGYAKFKSSGSFDGVSWEDAEKIINSDVIKLNGDEHSAFIKYTQALNQARDRLNFKDEKDLKQFDINELDTLTSLFENSQKRLGESGTNILQEIFDKSGKSADELTKLLANVNWGDPAAVQKLNDEIEAQGLAVDTSSDEWQEYCAMMQESARAMGIVSLGVDSLRQKIAETNEIIEGIQVGSIISDEEYAALVATNPELEKFFGIAANGYKFLGTKDGRSLRSYLLGDSEQSLEDVQKDFEQLEQINENISHMFKDNGEFQKQSSAWLLPAIDDSLYKYLGYDKESITNTINEVNNYNGDENDEEYQKKLTEANAFYEKLESIHQQWKNGRFEDTQAEELWASNMALGVKDLDYAYQNLGLSAETYNKYLQQMADTDLSNITNIQQVLASNSELSEEQTAYLENLEKQWGFLGKIADRTSLEYQRALMEIENTISGMKISNLFAEYSEIEIDVNANSDPLEEQLDKISDVKREIVIEIVADAKKSTEAVVDQVDGILSAASKIGAGYKVARADIESVAEAFPGILEQAQVLADGTVQLDQQKASSAVAAAQAALDANRAAAAEEIQLKISTIESQIEYNNLLITAANEGTAKEIDTKKELEKKYSEYKEKILKQNDTNENEANKDTIKDAKKTGDEVSSAGDQTETNIRNNLKEITAEAAEAANSMIENAWAVADATGEPRLGKKTTNLYGNGGTNTTAAEVTVNEDAGSSQADLDFDIENDPTYKALLEATDPEAIKDFVEKLQMENDLSEQQLKVLNDQLVVLQSTGAISEKTLNAVMQGLGGALGGSSQPATKIKETKKTEVVERYKETNDLLDDLADSLSDVEKITERVYGKTRLKGLEAQNNLIQKEIALLKKKKEEAKQYLAIDKQALQQAGAASGLSFSFDKEGNISNYTGQMEKVFNELSAAEKAWNASYKGKTQAQQQKYMNEVINPIKDRIDDLQDAIKQYDETRELIEDVENQIDDKFYSWQDNNYEILHYTLEIEIELKSLNLEKIDYYLNKIKDDFYELAEALTYMNERNAEWIAELADYKTFLDGIDASYAQRNVSQAQYVEGLKETKAGIYQLLNQLNDHDKEMLAYYEGALKNASDRVKKHIDHLSHLTSVLDHYKNVVTLINGEFDYDRIDKILGAQLHTVDNELNALKRNYQVLLDQKNQLLKDYAEAESDAEKEMYQQEIQAVMSYLDEAQSEIMAKTEEWGELLKEKMQNAGEKAFAELEDFLTNTIGFDALSNSLDRLSSNQEEFLTKTNQVYETQKMMQTAQKASDATDNQASKVKLKNFINETKSLQNKNQLSKMELELQQAKYDMLLAQIALEDAKDAKDTVRLRRDSEGNFGYVYTADLDNIAEKEQELADAENALYNLSLENANNYGQKRLEIQQQWQDAVYEVWQKHINGELSKAEYEAEVDRIDAEYSKLIETYTNNYNTALGASAEAQQDAWIKAYEPMMKTNAELSLNTQKLYEVLSKTYEEYRDGVSKSDIGNTLENLDTLTKDIVESSDEYSTVINDIIDKTGDELIAVREKTKEYAKQREEILKTIALYEDLIDVINEKIKYEATREDIPLTPPSYEEEDYSDSGSSDKKPDSKPTETDADPYEEAQRLVKAVHTGQVGNGGYWLGDAAKQGYSEEAIQIARDAFNNSATLDEKRDIYNQNTSSNNIKNSINNNDDFKYSYNYDESLRLEEEAYNKKITIVPLKKESFATGGYTGAWGSDGRLAVLHQKELVLNADDTKNFLAATEILRGISQFIDLQVASSNFAARKLSSSTLSPSNGTLEQVVTIEANFPSVQDRNEIQEAFNNLINAASQYANRKV